MKDMMYIYSDQPKPDSARGSNLKQRGDGSSSPLGINIKQQKFTKVVPQNRRSKTNME